ncbi:MAG: hypothetical protein WC648_03305 [Candidatus Paceibacterota bacterium]|jgi:hypothetical protein
MRHNQARKDLGKDIVLIIAGAVLALLLSKIGAVDWLISFLGGGVIASFVSGIFFTSVFTLAPASVALVHLAEIYSPLSVAFWGALGAMCGDLILFLFIRDRFTDDLIHSIKPKVVKSIMKTFHFGFLKWLAPILGAVIIASPLPDELGLTLLGMSKTKIAFLLPLAFVMNFIGIYLIAFLANFCV